MVLRSAGSLVLTKGRDPFPYASRNCTVLGSIGIVPIVFLSCFTMSFRQHGFQFKSPAVFCSRDSTDGSSSRAVAHAVDENHRDLHQKTEGDVLLVSELNQLSMEERIRALEDVHGVGEIVKETPELVEESLELLETEINKVRSRTAYEKAAFMSPSYPKDRDFRLMFLRADFFNPKKAAKRLVSYFDHKLRLFGINKLVKPITLDDLDEEDLRDLNSGSLQVLPQKDRAGRTIIISFHEKHGYKTFENHHRMAWYTVMSLLEDPDAQRLGLAVVMYNVGYNTLQKSNLEFLLNSSFLSESLPLRYASCHFCYDDVKLLPLMSAIQMAIGKEARIRFRAHFGSDMEVLYSLNTFGLSRNLMPLDEEFNVTTDNVMSFVRRRKEVEGERERKDKEKSDNETLVKYPQQLDVVLGRGRPFQEFPGNTKLAGLIDDYRVQYMSVDRRNKTKLTHALIQMVKDYGGRFLKRTEDGSGNWIEVSDDTAREKVSHGFRTRRRSHSESAFGNSKKVKT